MPEELFPDEPVEPLQQAFAWWEKKRLLYNVIVGLTGVLVLLSIPVHTFHDIPGVILFGILANLCYSAGFLLEAAVVHYLKKGMIFAKWRVILFWSGLIFSVFVTVMAGFLYVFTTIFNF